MRGTSEAGVALVATWPFRKKPESPYVPTSNEIDEYLAELRRQREAGEITRARYDELRTRRPPQPDTALACSELGSEAIETVRDVAQVRCPECGEMSDIAEPRCPFCRRPGSIPVTRVQPAANPAVAVLLRAAGLLIDKGSLAGLALLVGTLLLFWFLVSNPLVALMAALLGVGVIALFVIRDRRARRRFSDSAAEAVGTVIRQRQEEATEERFVGDEYLTVVDTSHFLTVSFKVNEGGRAIELDALVSGDFYAANSDGDNLTVRYDPCRPEVALLEGESGSVLSSGWWYWMSPRPRPASSTEIDRRYRDAERPASGGGPTCPWCRAKGHREGDLTP